MAYYRLAAFALDDTAKRDLGRYIDRLLVILAEHPVFRTQPRQLRCGGAFTGLAWLMLNAERRDQFEKFLKPQHGAVQTELAVGIVARLRNGEIFSAAQGDCEVLA